MAGLNGKVAERREAAATGRPVVRWVGAIRRIAMALPHHVLLIAIAAVWSLPTIALLVSSFREPAAMAVSGWWHVMWQPFTLTFDNYEAVLTQRGMGHAFLNGLIITVPARS